MRWCKKRNKALWYLYDANGVSVAAVLHEGSARIVPIFGPVPRYRVYVTDGSQLVATGEEFESLQEAQRAAEQTGPISSQK